MRLTPCTARGAGGSASSLAAPRAAAYRPAPPGLVPPRVLHRPAPGYPARHARCSGGPKTWTSTSSLCVIWFWSLPCVNGPAEYACWSASGAAAPCGRRLARVPAVNLANLARRRLTPAAQGSRGHDASDCHQGNAQDDPETIQAPPPAPPIIPSIATNHPHRDRLLFDSLGGNHYAGQGHTTPAGMTNASRPGDRQRSKPGAWPGQGRRGERAWTEPAVGLAGAAARVQSGGCRCSGSAGRGLLGEERGSCSGACGAGRCRPIRTPPAAHRAPAAHHPRAPIPPARPRDPPPRADRSRCAARGRYCSETDGQCPVPSGPCAVLLTEATALDWLGRRLTVSGVVGPGQRQPVVEALAGTEGPGGARR